MLHLIRKQLDRNYDDNENYSFANDISVVLYNENNDILSVDNINIGIGEKLFDKIIAAASTNDAEDYYKIIHLLNLYLINKKIKTKWKKCQCYLLIFRRK